MTYDGKSHRKTANASAYFKFNAASLLTFSSVKQSLSTHNKLIYTSTYTREGDQIHNLYEISSKTVAFSRKTVDNFSHFSSCHIIFSDNQYNSVATQAVPILHQGSQQDIKVMLGPDFHYFNQGRDPKLCTLGDKHNLHYKGKIRKKKYFVCKNHRKLLLKH